MGWRGGICDKKIVMWILLVILRGKNHKFSEKGGGTLIQNILLPILVTPEKDQHCFPKQRGWGEGGRWGVQRLLGS